MTIDVQQIRRLIVGWKPAMTVEVKVSTLSALLDELERVEALLVEVTALHAEVGKLLAKGEALPRAAR